MVVSGFLEGRKLKMWVLILRLGIVVFFLSGEPGVCGRHATTPPQRRGAPSINAEGADRSLPGGVVNWENWRDDHQKQQATEAFTNPSKLIAITQEEVKTKTRVTRLGTRFDRQVVEPGFLSDHEGDSTVLRASFRKLQSKKEFGLLDIRHLQQLFAHDKPWECHQQIPQIVKNYHHEALQILQRMTTKERAEFVDTFEPEARAFLEDSVEKKEIGLVAQVARAYRGTPASQEALHLLVRYAWDEFRPEAAALFSLALLEDQKTLFENCSPQATEILPVMRLVFGAVRMEKQKRATERRMSQCGLPLAPYRENQNSKLKPLEILEISFAKSNQGSMPRAERSLSLEWNAVTLLGYRGMEHLIQMTGVPYSRSLFCAAQESPEARREKLDQYLSGWCQWSLHKNQHFREESHFAASGDWDRHLGSSPLESPKNGLWIPHVIADTLPSKPLAVPSYYWERSEKLHFLEMNVTPRPLFLIPRGEAHLSPGISWQDLMEWASRIKGHSYARELYSCLLSAPFSVEKKRELVHLHLKKDEQNRGDLVDALRSASVSRALPEEILQEVASIYLEGSSSDKESNDQLEMLDLISEQKEPFLGRETLKEIARYRDLNFRKLAFQAISRQYPQDLKPLIQEIIKEKGEYFLLQLPPGNFPWKAVILKSYEDRFKSLYESYSRFGSDPLWVPSFVKEVLIEFPETPVLKSFLEEAIRRNDNRILKEYMTNLPLPLPSWLSEDLLIGFLRQFSPETPQGIDFLTRFSESPGIAQKLSETKLAELLEGSTYNPVRGFAVLTLSRHFPKSKIVNQKLRDNGAWDPDVFFIGIERILENEKAEVGLGPPLFDFVKRAYENSLLKWPSSQGALLEAIRAMSLSEKRSFFSSMVPQPNNHALASFLFLALLNDEESQPDIERFWHYLRWKPDFPLMASILSQAIYHKDARHYPLSVFDRDIESTFKIGNKELKLAIINAISSTPRPKSLSFLISAYLTEGSDIKNKILKELSRFGDFVPDSQFLSELQKDYSQFDDDSKKLVIANVSQWTPVSRAPIAFLFSVIHEEIPKHSSNLLPSLFQALGRIRRKGAILSLDPSQAKALVMGLEKLFSEENYRFSPETVFALQPIFREQFPLFRNVIAESPGSYPAVASYLDALSLASAED